MLVFGREKKTKNERHAPKSIGLLFHHHPPCLQSLGYLHLLDPKIKKCWTRMPWLHGWKGSYKSSGTYTNKVRSMSIVYFSSGEGISITDLSQDTGGNRLMRMMIMIMMMCCDWHCSHSLSGKKNNMFAVMLNIFWTTICLRGIQTFFGQLL